MKSYIINYIHINCKKLNNARESKDLESDGKIFSGWIFEILGKKMLKNLILIYM